MHVESHDLFQDPYFSELLQGMSDTLSESATGMMFWLGNRTKQETLDQILRMGLLEGVIVTAYNLEDPLVDGLLASSVRTVLVGHRRADRSASYVDVDHVRAADAVTSHLVDIGRRRIGHITGRRGTVAGEDRIVGYAHAMARRACRRMGSSSTAISDGPPGVAGALELLDRDVDAIFCANDATAAGALESIRARGFARRMMSRSRDSTISTSPRNWTRR